MNRKLMIVSVIMGLAFAVVAAPAAAQHYLSYVVQREDTLSKIAVSYCTAWQAIYDINRQAIGNNPDAVEVGTVLTIPARCVPGTRPPSGSGVYDRGQRTHAAGFVQGNVYTVAWGDTLFSIGQRFGLSTASLVNANHLADPNNIYTGLRLLIPGLQGGGTVAPPVIRPPSTASRSFGYSECTVQFNSTTNIWNSPNGTVIASVDVGTSPARQVQLVNNVLWYQFEYLESTPWIPSYLVGTIGNCGL